MIIILSLLSNIQLSNIHHFWTSWENPGIASSSWSSHNTDPRRRASGTVSLPVTAQIRWVGSTTTSKMQSAWTSIVYIVIVSFYIILIYFPWGTRKKKSFCLQALEYFSHLETSWNILPGLGRTSEAAATGSPASPLASACWAMKTPTMATDGTPAGLHGSRKSRDRLAAPPVPEALRRLVQLV